VEALDWDSICAGSPWSSGEEASATSHAKKAAPNSGFAFRSPNNQGKIMASLLILDDDEGTLAWMSAALAGLGHNVRAFRSGRDALAVLADWRPDLIIADILMPEMDGLTFARLVQRLKDVPVMFVSIAKKQAEAILTGAVGYVQKPATAQEVRNAVASVLGRGAHQNAILVVDDDPDIR